MHPKIKSNEQILLEYLMQMMGQIERKKDYIFTFEDIVTNKKTNTHTQKQTNKKEHSSPVVVVVVVGFCK